MTTRANRLANETSPYLLQHAHNPVDWYAWGPEALARAQAEDKPIFLSIGYAACHWCHVMEHESFENAAVAEFLNQHFVCIKVDREERPDIDDIYMSATVAITGSGGWPMSVFLAPDQRPFFAGTYFPPDGRGGRPGFLSLLRRIQEAWSTERESLFDQAEKLTEFIRQQANETVAAAVPRSALERATRELARTFDERFGGFGTAPKFPPHQGLRLLLRHYRHTQDPAVLKLVTATLNGMKNGGIYDHIAGGFARYSTDERWLVPHFEKMLYDNAQLAVVYLEAFQVTQDAEYQRVARETLDYVVREMQDERGGYYSATDADSEGEEGKFFVFLPEEIDDILGKDDAEAFCLYYDISVGGNWEGKNIPHTPHTLAYVAEELGMSVDALTAQLRESKAKVYAARQQRVPPLLDDKVLTAWNGLMIEAMALGYRVLGDARYLESAERAAHYLLRELSRPDGGLYRTARAGTAHIPAFLEDYAYLADALVSLYEASFDLSWLQRAETLAQRIVRDFSAEEPGAFFHTASDAETLIRRTREGHDGALPNPNAVAARALARLGVLLDRDDFSERATAAVVAYGQQIERVPRAFATTLSLVDFLLEGATELVLVGERDAPDTRAFASAIAQLYNPNGVLLHSAPSKPSQSPLAQGKTLLADRATLYVCRHGSCQRPIDDTELLRSALEAHRASQASPAQLTPPDAPRNP